MNKRTSTQVLYVRIDGAIVEWIRRQAVDTGMSMADVAGGLLAWCRTQGAEVTGRPQVTVSHLDEGR